MRRPSQARPHQLRWPFKPVALGASALLLALALACGAAEQPQEQALTVGTGQPGCSRPARPAASGSLGTRRQGPGR